MKKSKEELMDKLEQIILELPQYRRITNEMCNKYIPNYVRQQYEQQQIYTTDDHSSSIEYCWDIYNTVPIDVIEEILDFLRGYDYE